MELTDTKLKSLQANIKFDPHKQPNHDMFSIFLAKVSLQLIYIDGRIL